MAPTTIDYRHWLNALDAASLDAVADAAETVLTIQEALANDGLSILGELFRDRDGAPIETWAHYPPDDCRDPASGAMFYYHAHDPEDWSRDEHGHFHLFVRAEAESEPFSHFMALSMTPTGVPTALFATNQWVTAETVVPAEPLLEMVDTRWAIDRARPSWLVVQWLTAMVTLLRPHMAELLRQRDARLAGNPKLPDDRGTHILSEISLDLVGLLQAIQDQAQEWAA